MYCCMILLLWYIHRLKIIVMYRHILQKKERESRTKDKVIHRVTLLFQHEGASYVYKNPHTVHGYAR